MGAPVVAAMSWSAPVSASEGTASHTGSIGAQIPTVGIAMLVGAPVRRWSGAAPTERGESAITGRAQSAFSVSRREENKEGIPE